MKLPYDKYYSPAYWTTLIQMALYNHVKQYLVESNITYKEFAEKSGVSEECMTQVMNGEFDEELTKLVKIALACNLIPEINLKPMTTAKEVEQTYLKN